MWASHDICYYQYNRKCTVTILSNIFRKERQHQLHLFGFLGVYKLYTYSATNFPGYTFQCVILKLHMLLYLSCFDGFKHASKIIYDGFDSQVSFIGCYAVSIFCNQAKLNLVRLLAGPFFHQAPVSRLFPLSVLEPTCENNNSVLHSSWDHQQIQAYKQP